MPGRGHSRGPGALASSSGLAAGPCPSRWRDLSLPISKTEPPPFPKPFRQHPGGEVRNSTYRRISCLVRNVKSWKAKREEGQQAAWGQRLRPPARPRHGDRPLPSAGRAQTPWGPRLAHLVLGQQLLGQATARTSHRCRSHTAPPTCLGTLATFSLPPSGRVTTRCPRQPLLGPPPPGPAPSLRLPGVPSPVRPVGSRLRAVPGGLEAGPGAGPDAPGRGPGLTAPPPGWAGRAGQSSRAGVQAAHALRAPRPRNGPGRSLGEVARCVLLTCSRCRGWQPWRSWAESGECLEPGLPRNLVAR